MARAHTADQPSTWLLQAKEFLDEARRLKPGPARNELREVAKVLRELAKLEARSTAPSRASPEGATTTPIAQGRDASPPN